MVVQGNWSALEHCCRSQWCHGHLVTSFYWEISVWVHYHILVGRYGAKRGLSHVLKIYWLAECSILTIFSNYWLCWWGEMLWSVIWYSPSICAGAGGPARYSKLHRTQTNTKTSFSALKSPWKHLSWESCRDHKYKYHFLSHFSPLSASLSLFLSVCIFTIELFVYSKLNRKSWTLICVYLSICSHGQFIIILSSESPGGGDSPARAVVLPGGVSRSLHTLHVSAGDWIFTGGFQ